MPTDDVRKMKFMHRLRPLILEGIKEAQHKDMELIKAQEEAEKNMS